MHNSLFVKIPQTNYKKFMHGKTITLKKNHQNEDKHVSTELKPKTKKLYNKIVRNLNNNKGVRINIKDLITEDGVKSGDGLNIGNAFKSVGHAIQSAFKNPVVKSVAKSLIPVATTAVGDAVGTATGQPLLGMAAGNVVGNIAANQIGNGFKKRGRKKGDGLKDMARKAYNFVKSKEVKHAVDKVIKHPTTKKIGHIVGRHIKNAILDEADKHHGLVKEIAHTAVNDLIPMEGQGMKRHRRGAGLLHETSYSGIGGVISPNFQSEKERMHERMAYVRSHRKVGGSFAPI